MAESKLSLDPDGNDFVLRRVAADGTTTEMKLSEADVLTLCQSVPNLQQEILSRRAKGADHVAVVVTEVVQIGLNQDSLGERVFLTLIAPSGSRITFALPPEIVRQLIEHLPARLAQNDGYKADETVTMCLTSFALAVWRQALR